MKRITSCVFLGLLVVSTQLMAQNKPIMGYDKVKWGASVADVRKAYNISDKVEYVKHSKDTGMGYIVQEGVSKQIEKRTFGFCNGILWSVFVEYVYDDENFAGGNLRAALIKMYGDPTREEIQEEILPYTIDLWFEQYSPALEVHLAIKIALGSDRMIAIHYYSPKIWGDYSAAKAEL